MVLVYAWALGFSLLLNQHTVIVVPATSDRQICGILAVYTVLILTRDITAIALNPTCVATHVLRIIVVSLNSPVVRSAGLSVIVNLSVRGKWHYPGLIPATLR